MRLTVLLPAYHEERAIEHVVTDVRRMYPDPAQVEILVVDDGSTDKTSVAASQAGARVVRHPYNKGNGAAIKTGIRAARGDVIVMMDADGQHDPGDIPRLLEPLGEGYDMVVGARSRGSQRWHRQLANSVYNILASYLVSFRVEDLTSGFRAIRRDMALQFCYLLPNTFSYPTTLTMAIIRAGHNLKYVDIQAAERVGDSKIRLFRDGVRFLLIMTKIAVLFSPLKVFLPAGLLVFSPGFVYAIHKLIINRPWTLPIVISVSVGTLIVMMGLLAEQIAMLRMQHIDEG
jgi:glycosyltransferase involved in cell wall biosynthesis